MDSFFAIVLYLIIIFGSLSINSYCLYYAFMSITTIVEPFFKMKVTENVRAVFLGVLTPIGCLIRFIFICDYIIV